MPPKSLSVYDAIVEHWRMFYVPPVLRDIQSATGLKSTSTVVYHYRKLVREGKIVMRHKKPVPVFYIQKVGVFDEGAK
jgi:SOS-response transcriptional repressor LexA